VRIVLDTNVFISGVFFSGPPYEILKAWRDGRVTIVASAEILEEYRRVGDELSEQFPGVDLKPFLALLAVEAEIILAPELTERVCEDPDDDKFLACALAGRCKIVVSGDKQLRKTSGYRGVEVVSPRKFLNRYLA
jgi:putative PIN family toxin of toxin-antitoxin system